MSDNDKPVFWANGTNGNLKEPHAALRETGWRYGDVPTASNFNWLFNQIQKDLHSAKTELNEHKGKMGLELQALKEEDGKISSKAKLIADGIKKHCEADERHMRIMMEICRCLRLLVNSLHQKSILVPKLPLPLEDPWDAVDERDDRSGS